MSVLVILFTAPLGVWLIGIAGPKLLTVGDPNDVEEGESDNQV